MLFGNNATIGLDLGSTGFRAVKIARQNGLFTVARWAAADFPAEITDWSAENCGKVSELILSELTARGIRAHWTAHSVSGEHVAPQYFNFPQLLAEDIAEAVRIEVDAAVPFKGEGALMSYLLFPDRRLSENKARTHGLAIAAEKEFVRSRLSALEGAHLDTYSVETDSTACANAFLASHPFPKDGTVAILNIGHRYSNLSLVGGEGTLLVRDMPWAGANVTQALAEHLRVDVAEAEKTKRAYWSENKESPDVLRATALEFVARLHDTIEYWASERLVPPLKHVYVTGGGSQVHGLPEFLAEEMGAPVERWSPVPSVQGEDPAKVRPWSFRLTTAFGLALRQFGRKSS